MGTLEHCLGRVDDNDFADIESKCQLPSASGPSSTQHNPPLCLLDLPPNVWAANIAPLLSERSIEALRLTCHAATQLVDSHLLSHIHLTPTVPWLLGLQRVGCSRLLATRFGSLRSLFLRPASAKDYLRRIDLAACLPALGPCPSLRALHLSGWPVPYQLQLYGKLPDWAPHLTELVLEGVSAALDGTAVAALAAGLPYLRRLSMRLGSSSYEHRMPLKCPDLAPLMQLTALELSGMVPNQATVGALAPLTGLVHLHLDLLHDGYDKGLQVLDLRRHTRLRSLALRGRPAWQAQYDNPSHYHRYHQHQRQHRRGAAVSPIPCPVALRRTLQCLPVSLEYLAVELPPWRPRPETRWPLAPSGPAAAPVATVPALQFLACPPHLVSCLRELGLHPHRLQSLRLCSVTPVGGGSGGSGGGGTVAGLRWCTADVLEWRGAAAPYCWPYCCGMRGAHDCGRHGGGDGGGDTRGRTDTLPLSASIRRTQSSWRGSDRRGRLSLSDHNGLRSGCNRHQAHAYASPPSPQRQEHQHQQHQQPQDGRRTGLPGERSPAHGDVWRKVAALVAVTEPRTLYDGGDVITALECLPGHLMQRRRAPPARQLPIISGGGGSGATADDGDEDRSLSYGLASLRHLELNARVNGAQQQVLLKLLARLAAPISSTSDDPNPSEPASSFIPGSAAAPTAASPRQMNGNAAEGCTSPVAVGGGGDSGCNSGGGGGSGGSGGVTLDLCLSLERDVLAAALIEALAASATGGAVRHLALLDLHLSYSASRCEGDAFLPFSAERVAAGAGVGAHGTAGTGSARGEAAAGDGEAVVDDTGFVTASTGGDHSTPGTAVCDDPRGADDGAAAEDAAAAAAAVVVSRHNDPGSGRNASMASAAILNPGGGGSAALVVAAVRWHLPHLTSLTLQPARNLLFPLRQLAGHPSLRVVRLLDVEEDLVRAAERPLLPRLLALVLALGDDDPWVGGRCCRRHCGVGAAARGGGRGLGGGMATEDGERGGGAAWGVRSEQDAADGGAYRAVDKEQRGRLARVVEMVPVPLMVVVPQLLAWEVEMVNREAEAVTGGRCACELRGCK